MLPPQCPQRVPEQSQNQPMRQFEPKTPLQVPLLGGEFTIKEEGGRNIGKEEVSRMLTDFIIQAQVMSMVMGLVDDEDGWDGPEYVAKHVYAIECMVGSQLINEMTVWNG